MYPSLWNHSHTARAIAMRIAEEYELHPKDSEYWSLVYVVEPTLKQALKDFAAEKERYQTLENEWQERDDEVTRLSKEIDELEAELENYRSASAAMRDLKKVIETIEEAVGANR